MLRKPEKEPSNIGLNIFIAISIILVLAMVGWMFYTNYKLGIYN